MKINTGKTLSIWMTAALLFGCLANAGATWSIVAVDPATGEVGSAGASHTPAVWPIMGIVGGKGVVVAQASGNEAARLLAVSMLEAGADPDDIMKIISSTDFSATVADQQFGIASLTGGTAGFTGSACASWAGHAGDDVVMVQGNILAGDRVVSDTLASFQSSRAAGKPLADSLVAALLAGSLAGGDSRADGTDSAMTAYVAVARKDDPAGKPSFAIIVPPQGAGVNPVRILSARFDALKGRDHPLFFPSFAGILLVLVGLPLAAGAVTGLVLRIKAGRRKFGLRTWIDLGISAGASAAAFFVLAGVTLMLSWAAPIYGSYTWMVPLALVVLSIPLFALLRVLYWLAASGAGYVNRKKPAAL